MSSAASVVPPEAAADGAPTLVASRIVKSFGASRALQGTDLTLQRGEVHGLLGANGAGKSTLSRIVAGHLRPDEGTLTFRSKPLQLASPRAGLDAGIALVTQETTLAGDLSVLENIFLPVLGSRERLSFRAWRERGAEILGRLGQTDALSLDAEVNSLSIAQRQLVEIAKALAVEAHVVIFDEPTASLSPSEVARLFGLIDQLRLEGRSIVFVSHRLEEVFSITDRVTVLREGRTVAASVPTTSLDQAELIRHMVGQDLSRVYMASPDPSVLERAVALSVRNLAAAPAVRNVSFDLHRGEILGLAGLVGAGRSETVEAIIGLRRRQAGEMRLAGKPFGPRKPAEAVRAGVVLVPEDRRRQSIIPHFSVRENLMLGHLAASRGFLCGYARGRRRAEELMDSLDLPMHRLADDSLLNFSGGMQQKIIIARWLMLDPKVLILDEPTRGVDIATRASVYGLLRRIADEGVAILVVSSDFEELLGVCERLVVISDGVSTAAVTSASVNEEILTLLAAPRSSMGQVQSLLDDLVRDHGGAAAWGLAKDDTVVCLACSASLASESGLAPGRIVARAAAGLGPEADPHRPGLYRFGAGAVLLSPLETGRGHDNGFIALRLAQPIGEHEATAIHERVRRTLGGAAIEVDTKVGEPA